MSTKSVYRNPIRRLLAFATLFCLGFALIAGVMALADQDTSAEAALGMAVSPLAIAGYVFGLLWLLTHHFAKGYQRGDQ